MRRERDGPGILTNAPRRRARRVAHTVRAVTQAPGALHVAHAGAAPRSIEDEALDRLAAACGAPGRATLQWIKASLGSTVGLIPAEDVQYFHADDKYTRVITADGER